MDNQKIEYRVRKINRYIVTRFHSNVNEHGESGGVDGKGEYENPETAYEVCYALCRAEHERLGWPIDDERIQYPRHPDEEGAERRRELCREVVGLEKAGGSRAPKAAG